MRADFLKISCKNKATDPGAIADSRHSNGLAAVDKICKSLCQPALFCQFPVNFMPAYKHISTLAAAVLIGGTHLVSAAETTVPTEPSNLTVKPLGVNSFELTWKDNSTDEIGFDVYTALKGTKPALYQRIATPNTTRAVIITNNLPGKQLVFQVAAYRGTPEKPILSKLTSPVIAKAMAKSTFGPPTKFRAVVVDDGQFRLLWKDNATRETGYQVDYKLATAKAWTQLGVQPGTSFSIDIKGFLPATNYVFRTRAISIFGRIPPKYTRFSKVVKVQTKSFQGPSNLVVTPEADAGFSFKWADNSSIEEGFELQKKFGTSDFTSVGTVTANETFAATVPGFTLDTDHQFRIRGYRTVSGAREYSAFSNVVALKSSTLTAPTSLAATTITNSAITLTWKAGSTRASGYTVEYREAGTTGAFTPKTVANLATTNLTGLVSGRLYEIRLKATAKDFLGNITASSAFTSSVQARVLDGILGTLHPPIFRGSSFFYQVEVSRVDALTSLTVTGLPAGLTYNPAARTVTGTTTENGLRTATITATFTGGATVSRDLILRIIRPQAAPIVTQPFITVNVAAAANTSVSMTGKFEDPDTTSAVRFTTSSGVVDIILYPLATPATVTNFLNYVTNQSYNDGFFHRSVADSAGSLYIVQGGGYQYVPANGFTRVTKAAAVQNEPGISNLKGTVAMAKVGGNPNSATSEFFVNLNDINKGNLDVQNEGFTVFGRVSAPTLAVMEGINGLTKKNYNILIGSSSQALTDVPITAASASIPIDPALLVKVPTATIAPILTYQVTSQNTGVATATVSGSTITVTGVAAGSTTLLVTATDLDGQTAQQNISVTVP
jgi:cyclophilin family peptidyl-prolyl cis-trans isomerase